MTTGDLCTQGEARAEPHVFGRGKGRDPQRVRRRWVAETGRDRRSWRPNLAELTDTGKETQQPESEPLRRTGLREGGFGGLHTDLGVGRDCITWQT
jgi:hypothetical protein